jgi:hypothetical protein
VRHSLPAVLVISALSTLVLACGPETAEVDGAPEGDLETDEAQLSSYPGLTEGSRDAIGVIKLANEGSLAQLTASTEVGLQKRTANAIIAARPFATLAQLYAVKYVGTASIGHLLDYARAHGYVPPPPPADDPMPTCEGAPMPLSGEVIFATGTQTSFTRSCDSSGKCTPWKQASGYAQSVGQYNGPRSLYLSARGDVSVWARIGFGYTLEGGGTYYCNNYDIGFGTLSPSTGIGTGQMHDGYKCNISGGSGGPGGDNEQRQVALKLGSTCLSITDTTFTTVYGTQKKRVTILKR